MLDLTAPEHSHSAAVEEAARWYATNRKLERAFVPVLRERFGLSTLEAIEAAKLAGNDQERRSQT